jgi:hypothetical protein
MLRARLAQAERDAANPPAPVARRLIRSASPTTRLWSASGLALAAAVLLLVFLSPTLPWTTPSGELVAFSVPKADLTPGSAVLESRDVVCETRREADPPVVSRAVALAVFRTYGIRDPRPNLYELDHLIAPELGGSTDVRNLWPQAYSGTWNAHLKDALEDHLFDLVCRGRADLRTVQQEIAANWIAAYKKYFETDGPLPAHRTFRKDRPWQ